MVTSSNTNVDYTFSYNYQITAPVVPSEWATLPSFQSKNNVAFWNSKDGA
jgi:hypothetical protein